jgi:hypothetical protein
MFPLSLLIIAPPYGWLNEALGGSWVEGRGVRY